MAYIAAQDLVVEFPVYGASSRSLKKAALRAATGGVLATDVNDKVVVRALDGVSFEWRAGDRVGLVGNNGSGKTTLLRALTGAYAPTRGALVVQGKVASMLSITLGMEGEATGYENVHLRGTLLGLSRSAIKDLVEEVAEFSELGEYMSMPMRTYSTGMMMRLAFGISTSVRADIVLMDEWLSVGDAEFSKKAEARLERLIGNAKILVMASHNSGLITKICNRVLHLDKGKVASAS